MRLAPETIGRFALDALALGEGEVCALFQRGFYLRFASEGGERYACVGDASLGRAPLNALVREYRAPSFGERVSASLEHAAVWRPDRPSFLTPIAMRELRRAAASRVPRDGLGCLVLGTHNALSAHAQPALDALERWLGGGDLGAEAESLIGLGPGLTPSGDDYLGGMLVALQASGRGMQAKALWRWLAPRLHRTSPISAAHLAAAAQGEAHEALHACLLNLAEPQKRWETVLAGLDAVGHGSGWDALAGVLAVADPRDLRR